MWITRIAAVVLVGFFIFVTANGKSAYLNKKKSVGSLYSMDDNAEADLPMSKVRFIPETCPKGKTNANNNTSLSPFVARTCLGRVSRAEANYKRFLAEARCTRQLLRTVAERLSRSDDVFGDGFQLMFEMDSLTRTRFSRTVNEALNGTLLSKPRGMCESLTMLQMSLSRGRLSAIHNTLPPHPESYFDSSLNFARSVAESLPFQLACMILFVTLLRCFARHLWSPMTVAGIIMGCFVISICFHCLRQYHERKADADAAMIRYMQEPCQGLPGDSQKSKIPPMEASYLRMFGATILPGWISPKPPVLSEPDSCAQTRKLALTSPLLRVDPWEAVVSTFSKTMLTPLHMLFEYVANAVTERGWFIGTGCVFIVAALIWFLRPSTLPSFMPRFPDPADASRRPQLQSYPQSPRNNSLEHHDSQSDSPKALNPQPSKNASVDDFAVTSPVASHLPLPALASPSPDRRRDLKKQRHKGFIANVSSLIRSDRRKSL